MTFQVLRNPGFLWKLRNFKVEIRRELINDRANPVQVVWRPYIVDVLGELVCRLLLFAIQFCEVKLADRVMIKGSDFSPLVQDSSHTFSPKHGCEKWRKLECYSKDEGRKAP